ncbi:HU family DNA-binding protein [Nonomuraea maritima]|uniref:HU family DNA-binding protein n=1 Tax=Nonomuraea maritima TaxID=683260 RepID=UPI003722415B
MNKRDLVKAVNGAIQDAKKAELPVDAELVVSAVIDAMSGALAAGGDVAITNFGRLKVVERKPRVGRNPSTGEKIDIAAKKAVTFTMGAELEAAVNGRA